MILPWTLSPPSLDPLHHTPPREGTVGLPTLQGECADPPPSFPCPPLSVLINCRVSPPKQAGPHYFRRGHFSVVLPRSHSSQQCLACHSLLRPGDVMERTLFSVSFSPREGTGGQNIQKPPRQGMLRPEARPWILAWSPPGGTSTLAVKCQE